MKDIVIQNNKYVKMQFKNIYVDVCSFRGDVYIELHSFYNPFESMLFRFLLRDAVLCNINNVAYNSLYTMCRRFYENSLKKMDEMRKAGFYKDKLAAYLVNNKKVEILSPHRIIAPFETKY